MGLKVDGDKSVQVSTCELSIDKLMLLHQKILWEILCSIWDKKDSYVVYNMWIKNNIMVRLSRKDYH